MTDAGRIGLNEVELGIPVPKFWALLMGRATGTGVADKLCGFAQMCTPQRALEVGMIDEVATGGQLLQVRTCLRRLHDGCNAERQRCPCRAPRPFCILDLLHKLCHTSACAACAYEHGPT